MQREEPAAGQPAHGQELGREPERTQEAHQARSGEAIREQLRGVLDRAKPVAQEREGMGHERDGLAHKERVHGDEREEHALKHKDQGLSYGL